MGPKRNHKCPYKSKAEGNCTTKGNVITEVRCHATGFEDRGP